MLFIGGASATVLATAAMAEENASNPPTADSSTNLHYQVSDLGNAGRQDLFDDCGYMHRPVLKLKFELHNNSTDVTGIRQSSFENTLLKAIHFSSGQDLNDTIGMRSAVGLEWTLDAAIPLRGSCLARIRFRLSEEWHSQTLRPG